MMAILEGGWKILDLSPELFVGHSIPRRSVV